MKKKANAKLEAAIRATREAVRAKQEGSLHNGELPNNIKWEGGPTCFFEDTELTVDELKQEVSTAKGVEELRCALHWWITSRHNLAKFRQQTMDGINITQLLYRLPKDCLAVLMLRWLINLEVLTGSETLDRVLIKRGMLPHYKRKKK